MASWTACWKPPFQEELYKEAAGDKVERSLSPDAHGASMARTHAPLPAPSPKKTRLIAYLACPVRAECRFASVFQITDTGDSGIAEVLDSCYPTKATRPPFFVLLQPPTLLIGAIPSSLQLHPNRTHGHVCSITAGRSGRGSSPWSMHPRSPGRTLPDRRQMRRTRQQRAARSSIRRSGLPEWRST